MRSSSMVESCVVGLEGTRYARLHTSWNRGEALGVPLGRQKPTVSYEGRYTPFVAEWILRLEGFPPFHKVEIRVRNSLTYIVGTNGTGKTTLLRIFAGCSMPVARVWIPESANPRHLGTLEYKGRRYPVKSPRSKRGAQSPRVDLNFEAPFAMVPSNVKAAYYQPRSEVSAATWNGRNEARRFRAALDSENEESKRHAVSIMREQLLILARENPEHVDRFIKALLSILGDEFMVQGIRCENEEVTLDFKDGSCPLEFGSGGLLWTMVTSWICFLMTETYGEESVLFLDEPENHLHPRMQRLFLPRLSTVFPKIRIVAATHNPLVLEGAEDASTYGLVSEPNGVTSIEFEHRKDLRSANDVLRQVMGVTFPGPKWVEERLRLIMDEIDTTAPRAQTLIAVLNALRHEGFDEWHGTRWLDLLRDENA